MDDLEDEGPYLSDPQSRIPQSRYVSSVVTNKIRGRVGLYARQIGDHVSGGNDDNDDEEEMGEGNDVKNHPNNRSTKVANDLDDEEGEDVFAEENDYDSEDGGNAGQQKKLGGSATGESDRRTKKRKLETVGLNYEFAPRVHALQPKPLAAVRPSSAPKSLYGGRNALTDWTEIETFILLDCWGDRFLQRGRKSLRLEEWQEVTERVSEVSKVERTDMQCRNRLDTLKKKYKKEKLLVEAGRAPTKWVYFKKMDALISAPHKKQSSAAGLSLGVDSGEYIFPNPQIYLNRVNGIDEMRDSPWNSEFTNRDEDDKDDSGGLPPKKRKSRRESNEGSPFKLLADSIAKFCEIYEKTENRKSQQMMEIEKMRMDFQREMEVQWRQITKRAHAEIAKVMQIYDKDNDHYHSGENGNG